MRRQEEKRRQKYDNFFSYNISIDHLSILVIEYLHFFFLFNYGYYSTKIEWDIHLIEIQTVLIN